MEVQPDNRSDATHQAHRNGTNSYRQPEYVGFVTFILYSFDARYSKPHDENASPGDEHPHEQTSYAARDGTNNGAKNGRQGHILLVTVGQFRPGVFQTRTSLIFRQELD